MTTASFDLCKKLFHLSGLKDTDQFWVKNYDDIEGWRIVRLGEICGSLDDYYGFSLEHIDDLIWGETIIPAYDLGYLLEKLPQQSGVMKLSSSYMAVCDPTIFDLLKPELQNQYSADT